jgi:excisionase family DNA binding protein
VPALRTASAVVADGLMSPEEVQAFLSVSKSYLYELLTSGALPSVRLAPRVRRIPRSSVVAYAAERLTSGLAPR